MKTMRDGSSDAACAGEEQAITLASAPEAELTFAHVIVEPAFYGKSPFGLLDARRLYDAQRRWSEAAIAERPVTATARGVAARFVLRTAVPHEQSLAAARDEKPDILVIGTHGRTGFNRLLTGQRRGPRSASRDVFGAHSATARDGVMSSCIWVP